MTETVSTGSTVPRRTLGIALRSAREAAGLTLKDAAGALDVSQQTVWRIENGVTATKVATVAALCDAYSVGDAMRQVMLGLAKETRARGWWHAYGDMVPAWFELYVGLEQTASRIRMFGPLLVPGLLQDRQYMIAAVRADRPDLAEEEVSARVQLKLSRQDLLTRTFPAPSSVDVILTEAVLSAEPEPAGTMRAQVWHLLQATELPTVSVRILPVTVGPHRASVTGAFALLDFRSDNGGPPPPSTVYMESRTGAIYLDKASEFAAYEQVWEALDGCALSESESIDLMSRKLKELNDREC